MCVCVGDEECVGERSVCMWVRVGRRRVCQGKGVDVCVCI